MGAPGGDARGGAARAAIAGLSAAALVAGGLVLAGRLVGSGAADAGAARASGWLDIPAPEVAFATLEGDSISLADYRGRIVLLNFWGSWCLPCLTEIPHLIEVQRDLEQVGGTIIGPAVESGSPEAIRRFAAEKGMTWPLWIADYEKAVGRFGVVGYPFTLLVDQRGVIRRTWLGPQTQETLMRDVRRIVREERRGAAARREPEDGRRPPS